MKSSLWCDQKAFECSKWLKLPFNIECEFNFVILYHKWDMICKFQSAALFSAVSPASTVGLVVKTPASHAGGPGFNPRTVYFFFHFFSQKVKKIHRPGIEPGISRVWSGRLNHWTNSAELVMASKIKQFIEICRWNPVCGVIRKYSNIRNGWNSLSILNVDLILSNYTTNEISFANFNQQLYFRLYYQPALLV